MSANQFTINIINDEITNTGFDVHLGRERDSNAEINAANVVPALIVANHVYNYRAADALRNNSRCGRLKCGHNADL